MSSRAPLTNLAILPLDRVTTTFELFRRITRPSPSRSLWPPANRPARCSSSRHAP